MMPTTAFAECSATPQPGSRNKSLRDIVAENVAENAAAVFARKGCCMCQVIKHLLHCHGVNPTIIDVDEQNRADLTKELAGFIGSVDVVEEPKLPAVFIGGDLFSGLDEIMRAHINGELMKRLLEARALWL